MKRMLAILLSALMLFSLAACGENSGIGSNNNDEGGGKTGKVKISTASIDGYDLPEAALAYVGTLDKAYHDIDTTFYIKANDAYDDAFEALVGYYASNGGVLDEANSTSMEEIYTFSWGVVTATHFSVDEFLSIEIVLNETTDNGHEENNSGTTEPDNTGNDSSEDNDVEVSTVEDFLAFYGFDTEELKPNHFTSFEELQMVGSAKVGKRDSKGIVKINVEKGKTTADDYNAWFEALYSEMKTLSKDGKLWYTAGNTMEAPTLDELNAESWWASRPGSSCYITVDIDGAEKRINVTYAYDVTAEQYKIIILVG